jgi:DNA-binding CsgD family transcriptional regulator
VRAPGGSTGPATSGRLLERERELEALDAAVGVARDGTAGIVLVEGPAGIGKSRLLAAARMLADARGVRVLAARGSELEREFPFGIVRQLFESLLVDEGARSSLLSGAAGGASAVFEAPGERAGEPPSEGSFMVLHGLYWLTVNLCTQRSLLLTVDDLHWCDRSSLRFLAFLARRLEDLPVLLVASYRRSEPGADAVLLGALTSDPQAQLLMPRLLTAAAVAEVARDRLGEGVEPAFAKACHAATTGNPLLLEELLKTLAADQVPPDAGHIDAIAELGPRAVSRAVLRRLVSLSADAVQVARSIAVLGDAPQLPVVAELAGLEPPAVAAATRELVQVEILRPEPPLGFVHPLVQAAIYADLAPGERELQHERAARLLAARGAPKQDVAAHVLLIPAHGEDFVVGVLRGAADAAIAKGDLDAAISSLRRALEEPLRQDLRLELLLQLGWAETGTSLPAAAEHLRAVYEIAEKPAVRGQAAEGLSRMLGYLDDPDDAADIAGQTARELPRELEDLARRLEAVEFLALFMGAEPHGDRLERLRGYRQIDPDKGIGARMLAAVAAWDWAKSAGPADRVCALARAALGSGELMRQTGGRVMTMIATVPLALADLDEAVDTWDALRAEAYRAGSVFAVAGGQLWGGYTQLLRGELEEAESELRDSSQTLTLWGLPTQAQWTWPLLAEVLVERGVLDEAHALVENAGSPPAGSDRMIQLDRARIQLLLAEGRPEEALVHADAFELHARWTGHPRFAPWRSLKAQALDRLGRQDEAVALAGEELRIAHGWGSPGTVGRSLRVLGTILRADGIAHLEQACALLEGVPARLEHAKALAALGAALRRAGKPTEAREPLRRALELADVCGAQPLTDEVRTEIYATGARPRTTALRGVPALTASERRVVALAAGGQTNRDIAQALYVTPKTVEVHLGNAYRKLEIRSRRQLARALEGSPLSPRH